MCYEPGLHMTDCNRYCPDRSDCRSLPDGDSGHSCRDERCSPSVATTDENWIKGKKAYILIRLVLCTALGCGIGGLARSRSGIAPVSTALFLYLIPILMSLPVTDLMINNGNSQRSSQASGFAEYVRILVAIYTQGMDSNLFFIWHSISSAFTACWAPPRPMWVVA